MAVIAADAVTAGALPKDVANQALTAVTLVQPVRALGSVSVGAVTVWVAVIVQVPLLQYRIGAVTFWTKKIFKV